MIFGGATAALFGAFAFATPSYSVLLIGVLCIATTILIVYSAQNGLTATLAREHTMTGQVSAVWNIVVTAPGIAGLLLGGALSQALEAKSAGAAIRTLFLVGAALMAAIGLLGILKPRSVFADAAPGAAPPRPRLLDDLRRLAGHRPIYPALMIWILWSFSPGSQTALQYHLANTLGLSDSQYGLYNAINAIALIPTYLLFGWASQRFSLGRLLWWAAVIGLPSMVPLLAIRSVESAMPIAAATGLMAGMANAAILDLVIRSCPKDLEGTVMMLGLSLTMLSSNLGDLVGAGLYDRWGDFLICVAAATVSNALILPLLPLIPSSVTATPDGAPSRT
jgi:Na+/melibiose symporter-like transporter